VFTESQYNVGPNGFALSSKGDEVYLFSGDAGGNLTGYYHGFGFGASTNGVSFGRVVVLLGGEDFAAQQSNTLGAANSGPRVGPVVITEVLYEPVPIMEGTNAVDDTLNEFIELENITSEAVPLFDPARPHNTWRLRAAWNSSSR